MDSSEAAGAETFRALHVQSGRARPVEDALVAEGALQILVNGAPYSMTMRTPGDDAVLALGLLFAEGLYASLEQVEAVVETPAASPEGTDAVALTLLPAALRGKSLANRRLASNASCGICGKISADDLETPALCAPVRDGDGGRLDLSLLPALESRMRGAQALFSRTGGCHAAAVFDLEGRLLVLKEDVGRHNAVDKAVGHLLRQGGLDRAAVLFISGRVSYEIVTKAAKAGLRYLLAVSAPSTLAVKMCRDAGITLLGFCRGGKATVYSGAENVRWPKAEAAGDSPEASRTDGAPESASDGAQAAVFAAPLPERTP
jgi:FdhD protein